MIPAISCLLRPSRIVDYADRGLPVFVAEYLFDSPRGYIPDSFYRGGGGGGSQWKVFF